jgi:cytochrome c556
MNRKSLTLSVVALALSLGACNKDPAEERQEARREMGEALDDHAEKVNEAQEENEADKGKEITQANKELADKQKEAYDDVEAAEKREAEDMDEEEGARVVERPAGDKPESEKDVLADRFEAYKDETKAEFQTRAQGRIAALEKELKSVEGTVDADAHKVLDEAKTSLAEAKKDLNEVVSGTEEVFDDGKAGVAVAINKARRKLERVKDDMTK